MEKINKIKKYLLDKKWLTGIDNIIFMAAGEYNENYKVQTKIGNYVFRINRGSQLNINNQIEYEYNVLKSLEKSSVTPKAIFYDNIDSIEYFNGGVMLMEFINGRPLEYDKDLEKASYVFYKVHSQLIPKKIIIQKEPLKDIAKESLNMINKYQFNDMENVKILLLKYYEKMIKLSDNVNGIFQNEEMCIVNTEVNSQNFIINDENPFLVDWEKAVVSYRYQDLGHFLVSTTTLWKSDYKYSIQEKKHFLKLYKNYTGILFSLEELFEKTVLLEKIILLRALSWCYMAYYEYIHTQRNIKNMDTFKKIKFYLDEAECFLK